MYVSFAHTKDVHPLHAKDVGSIGKSIKTSFKMVQWKECFFLPSPPISRRLLSCTVSYDANVVHYPRNELAFRSVNDCWVK